MEPLNMGAGRTEGSIPEETELAINPAMLQIVLSKLDYQELEPEAQEYFKHDFQRLDRTNDATARNNFNKFRETVLSNTEFLSKDNKDEIDNLGNLLNERDPNTNELIPINNSLVNRILLDDEADPSHFEIVKHVIDRFCEHIFPDILLAIKEKNPNWKDALLDIINSLEFFPFINDNQRTIVLGQFFQLMPKENNDYSKEIEVGKKITNEKLRDKYFKLLFQDADRRYYPFRLPATLNELLPIPQHLFLLVNFLSSEDRQDAIKNLIKYQIDSLKSLKANIEQNDLNNKFEYILNLINNSSLNDDNTYYLLRTLEFSFGEQIRDRVGAPINEILRRSPELANKSYDW